MLESGRKVWLLDPTAKPQVEVKPMAPRHRELRGKRIGILDNTKSNADVLMVRLAELLQASYGVDEIVHRRKAHAAIGAGEELLDEMASRCDMVLLGSGDWGSCTSWSIHDAVEMESRGIPTVMICTDEFSLLGRNEAESLGMPALPIALVPHPIGGQKAAVIHDKAAAAVEQIVSILTAPEDDLMQQFLGKV